jgi:UDP-glucose 4-epimerase
MKNVLITGAAGFIGSYLANCMHAKEYNLTLVDSLEYGGNKQRLHSNLRSKLIVTNLLDNVILTKITNIEIVIHLAGISSLPTNECYPTDSMTNNFLSTVNLYEWAIKNNVSQFYFASTSAVYENTIEYPFLEESVVINPDLMYSYSKKMSEDYLRLRSFKKDALNVTILRFFNVFGSGQNTTRLNPPLTGYLIECLLNNKEARLFNKSEAKRDYIHVKDIENAIVSLIKTRRESTSNYEIYNLCSGNTYSVTEIIRTINEVSGRVLKVKYSLPEEMWANQQGILTRLKKERIQQEVFKNSIGSNNKLLKVLGPGYQFINMKDGISEMIQTTKI